MTSFFFLALFIGTSLAQTGFEVKKYTNPGDGTGYIITVTGYMPDQKPTRESKPEDYQRSLHFRPNEMILVKAKIRYPRRCGLIGVYTVVSTKEFHYFETDSNNIPRAKVVKSTKKKESKAEKELFGKLQKILNEGTIAWYQAEHRDPQTNQMVRWEQKDITEVPPSNRWIERFGLSGSTNIIVWSEWTKEMSGATFGNYLSLNGMRVGAVAPMLEWRFGLGGQRPPNAPPPRRQNAPNQQHNPLLAPPQQNGLANNGNNVQEEEPQSQPQPPQQSNVPQNASPNNGDGHELALAQGQAPPQGSGVQAPPIGGGSSSNGDNKNGGMPKSESQSQKQPQQQLQRQQSSSTQSQQSSANPLLRTSSNSESTLKRQTSDSGSQSASSNGAVGHVLRQPSASDQQTNGASPGTSSQQQPQPPLPRQQSSSTQSNSESTLNRQRSNTGSVLNGAFNEVLRQPSASLDSALSTQLARAQYNNLINDGFTAKEALEDILADYAYEIAVNEAKEKREKKRLKIEERKVSRLEKERLRRQKRRKHRHKYGY